MTKIKKILISACELSADNYAAQLARALKEKNKDIELIGIGSVASKKAGIDVKFDMSALSTVGVIEPLRYLPRLLWSLKKMKQLMVEEKPDLFIPIDNQGFHMLCCKKAKKLNIPVNYFIAPQHWHWGTLSQGKEVGKWVDKVLAIFPQEKEFYSMCGVKATYVGHPCTDRVRFWRDKQKKEPILAVFPGSRRQEIERLLPVFLQAAQLFCEEHQLKCIVSVASLQYDSLIKSIVQKNVGAIAIHYHYADSVELMAKSTLSLVTSGTVSLEHALIGVPHVVAYKFNPITFWIANTFFKKTLAKIPFMSMPNTLMKAEVFPELLQSKANKNSIRYALDETYLNHYKKIEEKCRLLWETLDKGNVSQQLADEILGN